MREGNKARRPLKSRLGLVAAPGPPRITYALIAANVAMFLVGMGAGDQWLGTWGMAPILVAQEPWRLLTAGFVHVGLVHLGFNMYVLWAFGSQLEQMVGRARYALLYFASLLGSSLVILLLASEGSNHVGASGAIFGLLGAYAVAMRRLNLPHRGILFVAAVFIGAPFVSGLLPVDIPLLSNLSWEGHLGGAVFGTAVMAVVLKFADRQRQGPGAAA